MVDVLLAEQDIMEELQPWVDKVLEALEHSEAFVSNLSMVVDFDTEVFIDSIESLTEEEKEKINKNTKKWLNKLSQRLNGIEVNLGDYIWQVAQRLKDLENLQ